MSTRRMTDTWLEAISRLERWAGDVAVCWAEAPDREGVWQVLGITVRGGVAVGDHEYRYEHLRLRSRMQGARDTARMLREGRVLRSMGDREFREIAPTESNAYWLTSGTNFGMMAPLPTPSYYFAVGLTSADLVTQAQLGEPVWLRPALLPIWAGRPARCPVRRDPRSGLARLGEPDRHSSSLLRRFHSQRSLRRRRRHGCLSR